jgi:hypothetical protein
MLRIPHCLDNLLTGAGKVVSLTHRPRFTPRNLPVLISATDLSIPRSHDAAGRITFTEKKIDDLPSGVDPATLWPAAQRHNYLCSYSVYVVECLVNHKSK